MANGLVEAIKEMKMVDQNLRNMAAGPSVTMENYLVYLADQVHNERIRRLIDEFGYPTADTIGKDGLKDFWLIIQHQDNDPTLQKKCLEKCGFEPMEKAYLTDRVLCNSGKEQEFGTQLRRTESGGLEPKPIRDQKSIDERRANVGLGSLAEYVKKSNEPKQ